MQLPSDDPPADLGMARRSSGGAGGGPEIPAGADAAAQRDGEHLELMDLMNE